MDIDAAVRAVYAGMCFDVGAAPAWHLWDAVMAPEARLVRVNDEGVFEFTPVSFRRDLEQMIRSGALRSFWEHERRRHVQQFGDIAHVLSVYEARSAQNAPVLFRAVKSMQLFERKGQWWISAMLWRREGRGLVMPEDDAEVFAGS